MIGNDNATLALIQRTLDDLDPDGTIRNKTHKGEAAKASPAASSGVSSDAVRRRVLKYLTKPPGAVSGDHGHDRTFEVAQSLVNGFCLEPAEALGYLLTEWNPKCQPPWSPRDLEHKVDEAVKKPCNKPRGWLLHARPPRDPAADPLAPLGIVGQPTPPATEPNAGLPTIVQQPAQLRDVVKAALDAVIAANDPPAVFVHGDCLVRIDSTADGSPVKNLSKPQLRLLLSQAADWVNESLTREGDPVRKAAFPKPEAVESVQDHKHWPGLPRLTSVADVPVITRASGLLTQAGYDAPSGVYLLQSGYTEVSPVAASPTAHDVTIAHNLILDELLGDFPFKDNASRANALALFLLPFVRDLIDGPTPLHHIDAPQEGTGKSLFVEAWGAVTLGREPPAIGEVSRPDDWQKLILAALIEAPRAIYLDNINQTLDSGNLASALTAPAMTGRLLGFSRMVSAPVKCVWVSTANNVRMSRELVRRTVYIRMDARREAAWQGRTFRHQLPRWAVLNRGELVWACLTLCQAWVAAGMPPGRQLLGKFEAWSMVIDGILSNAGIGDLLGNADTFRQTAVDSQDEWRPFLAAWWRHHEGRRVGVADLYRLAVSEELLDGVLGDGAERSQRIRLGKALGTIRERVVSGFYVAPDGTDKRQAAMYRLVNQNPPEATQGDGQEGEGTIPL